MTRGKKIMAIVASSLLAALFVKTAPAKDKQAGFVVDKKSLRRLATGEIIIDEYVFIEPGGNKRLTFIATALVKASPETAWSTVRDYDRFHEFMPRVSGSKVLKEQDGCMFIRYEAKVLWIEVVYHIKGCATEPGRRVDFELAKGYDNMIKDTYGFWEIQPVFEGKAGVLSYSAYLDPGIPVPEAISLKMAKESIHQVMINVRKRAESDGKWKKPR